MTAQHLDSYDSGDFKVDRYTLNNGLTAIIWADHRAPVLSYQTWFGVGSRHEQPKRTGMAHLFEHLMFKATKNMAEGEFDRILEAHGAQSNAATWVDWTYYRAKLPSRYLDLICRLEADRMENMILNADQLESEREVVVNERLLRVDNDPEGTLYEHLYKLAYGKHPYGWPTIGWMEDIRAIGLDDCLAFYNQFYAPSNATVVLVGDVKAAEAIEQLQRCYGHLPKVDQPDEIPAPPPIMDGPKRQCFALPVSSERAIYAWHAVAIDDPDLPALEVLDEVLTGGESSRLYKRLVTDTELATECGGWVANWRYPGLYELTVTMRPDQSLEDAEEHLFDVLRGVCDAPVSERELEKANNGLEAHFLREMADTGSRAQSLGSAQVTARDFRWMFTHPAALKEVKAADVMRVAKRLLKPERHVCVVGEPQPNTPSEGSP